MSYGMTTAGFVLKRFQDIKAEWDAFFTTLYGDPNLNSTSVIGRKIAGFSKQLTALWELVQLVYNAPFIALTDAGSIDNVFANEGATRLPATATTLNLAVCTFSGAATIPEGALVQDQRGVQYAAVADIVATGAGTVAGSFACTVTGPTAFNLSDTYSIVSPVSGWDSIALAVANPVTVGRTLETLAEARLRYQGSTGILGAGTDQAIEANVKNVPGVLSAKVRANRSDATDADLLPPHSQSVLVFAPVGLQPDLTPVIARTIWNVRGDGVQLVGTTSDVVYDSNGDPQTINFSYVENVEIDLVVGYALFNEETAPDDPHAAILEALNVAFAAMSPGEDVLYGRLMGALYTVPGLKSFTLTVDGGTSDVTVTIAQIAVLGTLGWA